MVSSSEIVRSIFLFDKVMLLEMEEFLKGCSIELQRLVSTWPCFHQQGTKRIDADESKNLVARQDPSADKLRYLVHLDDCRASVYEGIVQWAAGPRFSSHLDREAEIAGNLERTADPTLLCDIQKRLRMVSRSALYRRQKIGETSADPARPPSAHQYTPELHSQHCSGRLYHSSFHNKLLRNEYGHLDLNRTARFYGVGYCLGQQYSCRGAELDQSLSVHHQQRWHPELFLENIRYHSWQSSSHDFPLPSALMELFARAGRLCGSSVLTGASSLFLPAWLSSSSAFLGPLMLVGQRGSSGLLSTSSWLYSYLRDWFGLMEGRFKEVAIEP